MKRNKIILLIFSICLSTSYLLSQDTLYFKRKKFASVYGSSATIDIVKSIYPNFVLNFGRRQECDLDDSLCLAKFQRNVILERDLITNINISNICVFYDKKDRIIEIGDWKIESFKDFYVSFYKSGEKKNEGKFNKYGAKDGEWKRYNRKGILKKINFFNEGVILKTEYYKKGKLFKTKN